MRKDGKLVEATWEEAYEAAGRAFSLSKQLNVLAGGRLANEDLYNLSKLATARKGKQWLYSYMAGGDLTAQLGLCRGSNLANLGADSAILVVASDLHEEAPVWYLRVKQAAKRGVTVIVVAARPTRLDAFAQHVIRYEYGKETETIKAFFPDNHAGAGEELQTAAQKFAKAANAVVFYGSDGLGLEGSQALAHTCANLLLKNRSYWKSGQRPGSGLACGQSAGRLGYGVPSCVEPGRTNQGQ